MKIIVPGQAKPTTHRVTCDECRCVFEFDQSETRSSPDPRDFNLFVVRCPTCHKDLYRNY